MASSAPTLAEIAVSDHDCPAIHQPHEPAPVAARSRVEDFHEPWRLDAEDGEVLRDRLGFVAVDSCGSDFIELEDREVLERIAACVNFCEGMPTSYLRQNRVLGLVLRQAEGL